jgi:UDP-glucose 4-epimerase
LALQNRHFTLGLGRFRNGTSIATDKELVLRYLITGGAGFIGSHLADALAAQAQDVTVVDDFSTGRPENIEQLVASGAVDLLEGSVTDPALIDDAMAECDCCIHLASAVGVKLVVSNPLETLHRIVHGSDIVIAAAARHDKRVLFASTSEVYGKSSHHSLHEDSDRVLGSSSKSRWTYAIAKSYGEALAHGYHREHGTDTTVIRLFNTIGARQCGAYGMVVPRLVMQAIAGKNLTVYGDGSQSRCFLHVADAVDAIIALAEHPGATGRSFNIGNPTALTILELARTIIARTRSDSQITLVPYEQAYDSGFEELGRRRPDTRALTQLTGWRPGHTVHDALDDVIAYQRAELAIAGHPQPDQLRRYRHRLQRAIATPSTDVTPAAA